MGSSLTIDKYHPKDEGDVIGLWKKCGLVVEWNHPERDIARKLKVGADLFLVGRRNSRVVATIMGGYDGHRGWINYLAVDPDLQRNGYAREMVGELEQLLLQHGCPKINLQVRTRNKDVIHFYQALGYRVDDVVSLGKRLIRDQDSGPRK